MEPYSSQLMRVSRGNRFPQLDEWDYAAQIIDSTHAWGVMTAAVPTANLSRGRVWPPRPTAACIGIQSTCPTRPKLTHDDGSRRAAGDLRLSGRAGPSSPSAQPHHRLPAVIGVTGIAYLHPSLRASASPVAPQVQAAIRLAAVDFVSPTTGWFAATFDSVVSPLMHTTDAGHQWTRQLSGDVGSAGVYVNFFDRPWAWSLSWARSRFSIERPMAAKVVREACSRRRLLSDVGVVRVVCGRRSWLAAPQHPDGRQWRRAAPPRTTAASHGRTSDPRRGR